MYSCHTSCEFLNAGSFESTLLVVSQWLDANPYDVVTVLIANSDLVAVGNFTAPIVNSGLSDYAYLPPLIPMTRNDWPTLSEMILTNKRAVIFMDYNANQTEVPYVLDQYTQLWETPFSPTNTSFPCTIERPPGITDTQADERMYLANHNLNVALTISGTEILIPDFANLTQVNADNGTSGLGTMARECRSMWGRPPQFLVVDFYDSTNGTVFKVAAQMNNVTYNGKCCGEETSITSSAALSTPRSVGATVAVMTLLFSFCI